MEIHVERGYEALMLELAHGLNRAQLSKGKERHANSEPFERQQIVAFARVVGVGAPTYQILKKTCEAVRLMEMGRHGDAVNELHDVMVYAAAAAIVVREAGTPAVAPTGPAVMFPLDDASEWDEKQPKI